jgi:DNA primase catalytic core
MEREELLALLSTYLDLQPTYRKDELKTLCPFHAETQPSCYINIEKMIYHCFGCGKAGTVTSMLRDLGIQLDSERAEAVSVLDVLSAAHDFFRQQLKARLRNPQDSVFAFLLRTDRLQFVEPFELGYAPPERDALLNALSRFPPELLKQSGLFSDSLYPLLQNRITIPLRDERGRIVAFAGRAISDEQKPKFINTRNTALFQKRAFLAFAYEAAQKLSKHKLLYIVEGYFDAMHFLINDIPAVCVMSTNLTLAQATLLKKLHAQHRKFFKDAEIVLLFDSDPAGIEATATNIAMLTTLVPPSILRVQILPQGRDPDQFPINVFDNLKRYDPVSGFVEAICRVKPPPSPEKVARALLIFPDEMRRTLSKMLDGRRKTLGIAYLRLVFNFFGSLLRRAARRPPSRPFSFDLYTIATAAVIQGKLELDQLGELIDEFPENLKRLLTTPLEQLTRTEQEQYAKLAFMPYSLLPEEIIKALLKASKKRKLLSIIQRLDSASEEELLALSKEFDEALSDFLSLTDQF